MLKVIIDTNIWISFLIGLSLKRLHYFLYDKQFMILISNEQINELIDVLSRSKLQKYFSKEQVTEFLKLIETKSQIVEYKTIVNICRDPKDNYLLSMAIDSKADYLITGDTDLLELKKIEGTQIINFKDFQNRFMR